MCLFIRRVIEEIVVVIVISLVNYMKNFTQHPVVRVNIIGREN